MDQRDGSTALGVELLAARREQEPILANLLELYIHDFSEFVPVELQADGRFGYPNLSSYWSDPDRHPFLIRVDGQWAGFVLVARMQDKLLWDMAEFFILRGFRRRGTGRAVAHEVWRRYPGLWQVRVMEANAGAGLFWKRAVGEYLGRPASPDRTVIRGVPWFVFSFQAGVWGENSESR
ncbi:MAG: GNAT family N-acetyltransferase [Acidobacteriaceae bacterium]